MKRIITIIAGAMMLLPTIASAQGDWAGVGRYADDNKKNANKNAYSNILLAGSKRNQLLMYEMHLL